MKKQAITYDIHRSIKHRTLELIVHAAYLAGWMSCSEQKSLTHPDIQDEVKRLKELLIREAD